MSRTASSTSTLRTVMKRFAAFVRPQCGTQTGQRRDDRRGRQHHRRRHAILAAQRSVEDARLRSAVRHALAMRNAAIETHHIQTLVDRETREKSIRIRNVERGVRAALRTAIKQAGIRRASSSAGDGTDWAVLFPESEARKFLFSFMSGPSDRSLSLK